MEKINVKWDNGVMDAESVMQLIGIINEKFYGINPYEKKAAFEPAISDEEDEKEKEPLPDDEEIDEMYDAIVGSGNQEYRNAH
jgi:hypothetical protein